MQGWHYGKRLIYYRPIFRLTKLAFLRASALLRLEYLLTAPKIEGADDFPPGTSINAHDVIWSQLSDLADPDIGPVDAYKSK